MTQSWCRLERPSMTLMRLPPSRSRRRLASRSRFQIFSSWLSSKPSISRLSRSQRFWILAMRLLPGYLQCYLCGRRFTLVIAELPKESSRSSLRPPRFSISSIRLSPRLERSTEVESGQGGEVVQVLNLCDLIFGQAEPLQLLQGQQSRDLYYLVVGYLWQKYRGRVSRGQGSTPGCPPAPGCTRLRRIITTQAELLHDLERRLAVHYLDNRVHLVAQCILHQQLSLLGLDVLSVQGPQRSNVLAALHTPHILTITNQLNNQPQLTNRIYLGSCQITIFDMTEHEKSILSQLTLDSHAEPLPAVASIHAGESNYQFYKYSKCRIACPRALPFGSSSARKPSFLTSAHSSDLLTSFPLHLQPPQPPIATFQPPFGSNKTRFSSKKKASPGPGAYNVSQLRGTKTEGGSFALTGRKDEGGNGTVGPGTYIIEAEKGEKEFELRCKLKLMMQQKREKQLLSKQKSETVLKMPEIVQMKEIQKPNVPKAKVTVDRFWLKENTEKYLQLNRQQVFQAFESIKLSGSNFSPPFIQRKDSPFQCYVQPTCSPSPTRYLVESSSYSPAAHSSFTSSVERTLFKLEQPSSGLSNKGQRAKEKSKLSWLL